MKKWFILFDSTNHAIMAEHFLKKERLKIRIVPVPRELSSNCGVCIQCEEDNRDQAVNILKISSAPFKELVSYEEVK
ncbi:MAG: DUF3343 domain-containing protein [Candidatus Delongbacteria bacterium]|nr:DUF3343 domain-containing protein [Candidatus Delongbacteria bacterium]MBN2833983.1 DUF3343 domain-containing protein [Candidatus Delongbacteria bacterium]